MKEVQFRSSDKPNDIEIQNMCRRASQQIQQKIAEQDLRTRIDELEAALMPFAALGKVLITETLETTQVHASECVKAYKTLYKQGL